MSLCVRLRLCETEGEVDAHVRQHTGSSTCTCQLAAPTCCTCLVLQYLALIDTFKEVHKEVEGMRNSGFSITEVKNDIKHMEREKDQLEKRVARMKQKVQPSSHQPCSL